MAEQQASESVIEAFKQRARDFWAQWQKLESRQAMIEQQSPAIKKEYSDLLDRGSTIRSSVETVTGLIDKAAAAYQSAKGWISDVFGLGGFDEQQTLGVLPVIIPAAVIATSLAAMGKWLSDAYQFNRKMEEIEKLQAKGVDAVTASKIIERTSPAGISIGGAMALPVLLIGGFIAYNIFMKGKG